jgi:hypothetical protein
VFCHFFERANLPPDIFTSIVGPLKFALQVWISRRDRSNLNVRLAPRTTHPATLFAIAFAPLATVCAGPRERTRLSYTTHTRALPVFWSPSSTLGRPYEPCNEAQSYTLSPARNGPCRSLPTPSSTLDRRWCDAREPFCTPLYFPTKGDLGATHTATDSRLTTATTPSGSVLRHVQHLRLTTALEIRDHTTFNMSGYIPGRMRDDANDANITPTQRCMAHPARQRAHPSSYLPARAHRVPVHLPRPYRTMCGLGLARSPPTLAAHHRNRRVLP